MSKPTYKNAQFTKEDFFTVEVPEDEQFELVMDHTQVVSLPSHSTRHANNTPLHQLFLRDTSFTPGRMGETNGRNHQARWILDNELLPNASKDGDRATFLPPARPLRRASQGQLREDLRQDPHEILRKPRRKGEDACLEEAVKTLIDITTYTFICAFGGKCSSYYSLIQDILATSPLLG